MSKIGAAFLIALWLAAGSAAAAEVTVPHHVTHGAAWGCSDKNELIDLLFLGLSASFDDKLAGDLASGKCVYFSSGETVTILKDNGHGIVKVQRGGAEPAVYWTMLRNLD
jgi:hypothetical protein